MAEKLFSKVMVIFFLVLLILGFTVPGFINSSNGVVQNQVEPRLCQTDADCYLTCDEQPVPVICLQNLCQQNECGYAYFEYEQNPLTFQLEVILNNEKISLENRTTQGNFFVKFENNMVKMYSQRLSLNAVLSKVGLLLDSNCLLVDGNRYCADEDNFLSVLIKGNETADVGNYIPQEGDKIEIGYGKGN